MKRTGLFISAGVLYLATATAPHKGAAAAHEEDGRTADSLPVLRMEATAGLESGTSSLSGILRAGGTAGALEGAMPLSPQMKTATAIDTVASYAAAPTKADTIDGVIFTNKINRFTYRPAETLRVQYRINNNSMGAVRYDFPTSCQFSLQVSDSRGTVIYSREQSDTCINEPSKLELSPGAGMTVSLGAIPLGLKKSDTLTVKAEMAGYPLSAVSVKALYTAAVTPALPTALEGTLQSGKPFLDFSVETKMLTIRLDHPQRLTVSAFVLTGKKVNKLSTEKFLTAGTHTISFNNRKLADGVVIFKVEGNGFSETKTINLTQ